MKESQKDFKKRVNKEHPIMKGYVRHFTKCKKCGTLAYYDYVPYSLSNPIMNAPCVHSLETDYVKF